MTVKLAEVQKHQTWYTSTYCSRIKKIYSIHLWQVQFEGTPYKILALFGILKVST